MKKVLFLFLILLVTMPAVASAQPVVWYPHVDFSEESDYAKVSVYGDGLLFITITLDDEIVQSVEGWDDGVYEYTIPFSFELRVLDVTVYAVVDGVSSDTVSYEYTLYPKPPIQCADPEIYIDETRERISIYATCDMADVVELYVNYDPVPIPCHIYRTDEPIELEITAMAGGENMIGGTTTMDYTVEPMSAPSSVPIVTFGVDATNVYVYVDCRSGGEDIHYSIDEGSTWNVTHRTWETIAFPRQEEDYNVTFMTYSEPLGEDDLAIVYKDVPVPALGSIYDWSQDGIYYKIVGDDEVYVTYRDLDLGSYFGDVVIPPTVTRNGTNYTVKGIRAQAFMDSPLLTSVSFPTTIERVEYQAFSGCTGLNRVDIPDVAAWCNIFFISEMSNPLYYTHQLCVNGVGITDLVIPDGVAEIQRLAWVRCTSIESVTIPPSVLHVGYSCFSGCTGINAVYISDLSAWCDIWFESMTSNPLYHGHRLYLNGTELTELVIPSDVKNIRNYVFFGYSGTSVTFDDGVVYVGLEAFHNCDNLSAVYINNLSAWCNINFNYFTSNPLFYAHRLIVNGTQLTELTIPSDVTEVHRNTFVGLSTITKLVIPNTVTAIDYGAFSNCDGLTTVTIPNSLSAIDYYVFYQCERLREVTLPSTITRIKVGAFNECPNLSTITVLATTPPTLDSNIDPSYSTATLRVPQAAVGSYQSANYWRNFVTIEGIPGAGPGDLDGDGHIGVSDVARLIDLFINNGELPPYADVDGDGMTNLRDLAALISMLLVGN